MTKLWKVIKEWFVGEPEIAPDDTCLEKNSEFQTCAFSGHPGKYRIKEPNHILYVCEDCKKEFYPDLAVTGKEVESGPGIKT